MAKEKSTKALKTISEAAEALALPQHVLRFWETKFYQIAPLKRKGSRRFYRPEDMATLQTIKELLHNKGYTIKGALAIMDSSGKVKTGLASGDGGNDNDVHQLHIIENAINMTADNNNTKISNDNRKLLENLRNDLSKLQTQLKTAI